MYGEKAWQQSNKNATSCIEHILEAASHKTAAVRLPTSHLENPSKLDEPDMKDTAGEVRTNSKAIYSCGPIYTNEQGLGDLSTTVLYW